MFTLQNILLFMLLALFLLNFQTILATFVLFFWELKGVVVKKIKREEIDESVQEIMKPNEEFLLSKGFVYKSSMAYKNMLARFPELHHTNYYYHEELGVHAFLDTTPLPGFLTSSVIHFVTFYESYKRSKTFDCFAYNIFSTSEVYLFDHYYGNYDKAFKAHLEDRVIEGETIVYETLSEEGAKDFSQYSANEQIEAMLTRNIIRKKGDKYAFAFSLGYVKYVYESLKMHKIVKKIYALTNTQKSETLSEPQKMLYKNSEEQTILAQISLKAKEKRKEEKIRTFFISGAFFVLFFGLLGIPWQTLPIIVTVLLVHELGHYFAMRYYGYQDTSIFFIPLFGAAAKGEKEHTKPFEEFVVFLAGPLPGMIIALFMFLGTYQEPTIAKNSFYMEYMLISFVINFINLLPIYPLDGGRVVQMLIFTRYPKAQFYFFLASLTVIILAAMYLKSILLGFFAVALFLNINHNYNLALLLSDLKKSQSQEPVKEKIVSHITANKRFSKLPIDKKVALAKQSLKLLNAEVPSKILMFLGMLLYLFLLLTPLLFMIITAIFMH